RVHQGSGGYVDLVQAREGARSDPAAAASVRIPAVLRQLNIAWFVAGGRDLKSSTAAAMVGTLSTTGVGVVTSFEAPWMATVVAPVRVVSRGFGHTARRDAW